ncbi:hypothetical protein FRC03_006305 [Tulasnella sp. 419]|nr:hypothetical protein FRC03_006305 [Tulasnella sp. 419]
MTSSYQGEMGGRHNLASLIDGDDECGMVFNLSRELIERLSMFVSRSYRRFVHFLNWSHIHGTHDHHQNAIPIGVSVALMTVSPFRASNHAHHHTTLSRYFSTSALVFGFASIVIGQCTIVTNRHSSPPHSAAKLINVRFFMILTFLLTAISVTSLFVAIAFLL